MTLLTALVVELRRRRRFLRLRQRDLAAQIGVSKNQVGCWERCEAHSTLGSLCAWAEELAGAFIAAAGVEGTYAECAAAAKALDIELPNGLTDLRVHDLRHNFASEGASVGLSLPMIGALLGHSNPATTARYAHLMDDPLRQAAERIGSRLTADEGRESA